MDRNKFRALVARMERSAQEQPGVYRWRVMGWAALGYSFVLLVILTLLACCVATLLLLKTNVMIAGKLLFVLVPAAFVVARATWIKFSPPEGILISRAEAPQLFAMMDDLSRQLRAPRIHEVRITPELNAAVCQTPRLGFLGWHRNYLLLGLPLMKGMSVDQLRAVVAHEMGHLSRGHARLGNWIYRLRQIWTNLQHEYEKQAVAGSGIIRRFFGWYAPRFAAISFPLARANEFEADAASARVTSPQAAAQALTSVNVLARFLDQKFWPGIHAAAKEQSAPAFAPYSGFMGSHIMQVPEHERDVWLRDAMAVETSLEDTHPALKDRLEAFGGKAEFAPPREGQGAEVLLGGALGRLQHHFDEQWRTDVEPSWARFYEETQQGRARLAELRALPDSQLQEEDVLLDLAGLEEGVGGNPAAALILRRRACELHPGSQTAQFLLGRQLLRENDAEGVALVTPLVEYQGFAAAVSAELRDFYHRAGNRENADVWHDRLIDASMADNAARRERDVVLTTDALLEHGLSDEQLAVVQATLRNIPALRRAWLVRKRTQYYHDVPFFVLGFSSTGRFRLANKARAEAVREAIRATLELPGDWVVFSLEGENSEFRTKLGRVRRSRVL